MYLLHNSIYVFTAFWQT